MLQGYRQPAALGGHSVDRVLKQPSDAEVRQFVAKLEAFATGLNEVEREMLRVALGIGRPVQPGDVRNYLANLPGQ